MNRKDEAIEKAAIAHGDWGADDKHVVMAAAIAAYETHMRPEVATVDEFKALPVATIVRVNGGMVWEKLSDGWYTPAVESACRLPGSWHSGARVLHWGTE